MADKTKENKVKKLMTKLLIYNGILIFLAIIALGFLYISNSQRAKIMLNNRELSNVGFNDMFKKLNDTTYVSIDQMVKLNQMKMYRLNNGRVDGQSSGSKSAFYINSIYEDVQFIEGTNTFTKHLKHEYANRQLDQNGQIILTPDEEREPDKGVTPEEPTQMDEAILNREEFKLSKSIEDFEKGKFIPIEDAKYVFNIKFEVSGNSVKMYTIDYLEKAIEPRLKNAGLVLNSNYQNRRAIIDDKVVIADNQRKWGLNDFSNGDVTNNIVNINYDDLRYSQASKRVYGIKNEQIALLNGENGQPIVQLGNYETLEVYSQEKGLYLVSRNKRYGLIDSSGEAVVPIEFTMIGYDPVFFPDEETNGRLFFDKIIPVMKDGKWGFYKEGARLAKVFDPVLPSLGYKKLELLNTSSNSSDGITLSEEIKEKLEKIGITVNARSQVSKEQAEKYGYTTDSNQIIPSEESVLLVPEKTGFGGIVVRGEDGKYGIVSSDDSRVYALPLNYDKIYKTVSNGISTYYAKMSNSYEILELKPENVISVSNSVNTSTNANQVDTNSNLNTSTNTNTNSTNVETPNNTVNTQINQPNQTYDPSYNNNYLEQQPIVTFDQYNTNLYQETQVPIIYQ